MRRIGNYRVLAVVSVVLLLGCSMYEFKDPTGAQMRIVYSASDKAPYQAEPQSAKQVQSGPVIATPDSAPAPAAQGASRAEKSAQEQPIAATQATARAYKTGNIFAVLVGISIYNESRFSTIKCANADAREFGELLKGTVGLPKENVVVLTDAEATLDSLETYIDDWLRIRAKKESTVIVYFSGHALIDSRKNNEAYLVPYDATAGSAVGFMPLKKLYGSLARLPVRQAVVLLDACFGDGGDCRTGQAIQKAEPQIASEIPLLWADKVVLITASSWGQPSFDHDSSQNSLFAYYVMRALRGEADTNKDGSIGLEEFFDYVRSRVSATAARELAKEQIPLMLPEAAAGKGLVLLTKKD